MKLIETIASNMDEYTKTEKKIATYIINNVLEFTLSTIGSVADELEVSKTSLIRFAKRMGFDGYIEFRKKLQEEEVMRFTPAERFIDLWITNIYPMLKKWSTKRSTVFVSALQTLAALPSTVYFVLLQAPNRYIPRV